MPTGSPSDPLAAHDPVHELMAFSEQTCRLIGMSRALAAHQRPVELDGLQHQVGLLCAKALDLGPGQGGLVKLELQRLLAELDALQTCMRENAA